ncbi:MAG: PQQ-binding-like beta-propeller repeat protein, partial [Zavarzinella sp.]|nr:PQQ-binding-like beta-propeller repeat protein [Zavarzinella sp.]
VWRMPGSSQFVVVDGDSGVSTFDASGRLLGRVRFQERPNDLFPMGGSFLVLTHQSNALVDVKTGKDLVVFEEHDGLRHGYVFAASPDGRRLYAMAQDGRLRTYDASSGKKVEELDRPAGWDQFLADTRIAVSPDGAVLYAWKEGQPTQRRDLKSGKWLDPHSPVGRSGQFGLAARFPLILPDGKRVVFVGREGILHRYDLATGREISPPDGFEGRVLASGSPNGRFVAATSTSRGVELYETNGERRWSLSSDGGRQADCAWSPDGQRLAFVSTEKITVRDAGSAKVIWSLAFKDVMPSPEKHRVECFAPPIAFNAAGDRLAVSFDFSYGPGQPVAVIDAPAGKPLGVFPLWSNRWALPTGRRGEIAVADREGFQFVDQATGAVRLVEMADEDLGSCEHCQISVYSPDGDYLLTVGKNGVAVLRDPRTGQSVRRIRVSHLHNQAIAFSPDGLWLATGSTNGMLAIWDVNTGEQVWARPGHPEGVNRVSFAGRRRLVSSSDDLTALVWDICPTHRPVRPVWEALSGTDGSEAWRAMWVLAADPKGPELLRAKVAALPAPPTGKMQQWLADLGADRFQTREAATRTLQDLGRVVESELRAARAATKFEEVRMRLDGLLAKIVPARTAAEIVQARAVAAMELAGNPAAKELLARWAGGAPAARLTIDSKAALQRLGPDR